MAGTDPFVSIGELLSAISPREGASQVSVGDILDRIGDQSFAPAILVPALILVSPISAIPTAPTIGALTIMLVALQAACGREHLWLPQFLQRRSISAEKLDRGLRFLAPLAGWIDRHSHDRLRPLTVKPLNRLAFIVICLSVITWPVLELLPMLTSIGAFGVALLSIGLMTRDGAYLVAGYAFVALLGGLALTLWRGLI